MRRALAFAVAASALVGGGLVAARATRDALFLSQFPASALPGVMMASAALSLIAAAALSRGLARAGPARAVPAALVASGALFLVEWFLLARSPRGVAGLLYLHVTALGPLLLSGFWSVVSERFDPHTAKRSVSRLAGAAALAGVLGGVAAERVVALAGMGWTLGLLFVFSAAAAVAVGGVGASEEHPASRVEQARRRGSTLGLLARDPLLAPMALLMLLGAAVDVFVDYALKAEAAAAFPETQQLVRFFAAFYVGTGLLAFALQAGLGNTVLRRFGLAGAMGVLPVAVVASGALALFSGRLWTVVLVRGVESVVANGLFRSGFELLYGPVPAGVKRPVKAWIDVSARGVGSIAGAGLVLFLLFVAPDLGSWATVGLAMAASAFVMVLVLRVNRSYVAQLQDSLRTGRVMLQLDDAVDATTARTITETHAALDRRTLLELARAHAARTEEREAARAQASPRATTPVPDARAEPAARSTAAPPPEPPGAPEPVLERVAELCSGDPFRVRRALHARGDAGGLRSAALDRRLVAHVIPLLASPALARDAEAFLRRVAPRSVGQLVDALLDRSEGREVRLALAGILSQVPARRAVEGLWLGLDDPDFAMRRAFADAATRVVDRRRDFAPPKEAIHARLEKELAAAAGVEHGVEATPLLEYAFNLLALLHGRETMRSALTGLQSGRASMRGTALEMLESVLPPGLRRSLSELIERAGASEAG